MPRPSKGAHTYYDKGRDQWQIRDTGGYIKRLNKDRVRDRAAAEKELAVYIASKITSPKCEAEIELDIDEAIASNPLLVTVPATLAFYGQYKVLAKDASLIGVHIERLLGYWHDKTLAQVKAKTCRAYVAYRTAMVWKPPGAKSGRPVSAQTARRELETLSAAIGVWHREHNLRSRPLVTLPEKAQPHPDWLTENEYQRMVRVAQGWRWIASDLATREPIWERTADPLPHLERFIHSAFFTGSRSAGILAMGWKRATMNGHIDFKSLTWFRSGPLQTKTRKREPPCRIHDRLLPLLKEWHAADARDAVEWLITYRGERIDRIDGSFVECARLACLDRREIDGHDRVADQSMGWPTPHIMRHTRATLMLQAGRSYAEVAEYLGMSVRMVETTYGHHHVEYQAKAAATA